MSAADRPTTGTPRGVAATAATEASPGATAPVVIDQTVSATALSSSRRLRTLDSILDVPAFRWYLLSMMCNWSALQMQQVVRGWLAYTMTDSFAALGLVAMANALPRLVFALWGGVMADRANRRRVLQFGQAASACFTVVITVLIFTDRLRFEHLMIAAALQGAAMSFSQPARQALIPDIVGTERLTNAYGLNSSGMNTMRLIAPALAGFIVALVGAGWAYALMSLLYVASVVMMFPVPLTRAEGAATAPRGARGGLRNMMEGFRYLGRNDLLRMLLIVHLFVVVLSLTFQRLLPGFVDEVLSISDAQTSWRVGVLLAVTGAGALLGSLFIASLSNRRRGWLLIGSIVVFAAALLGFALSTNFWLSIGIVFVLGLGQAGRQSLSQILIQTHVANEYRGRISSIMMMEMGLESLGTFTISLVAVAWGAQAAFGTVAVSLLAVALVVALFLPAYRRLQ